MNTATPNTRALAATLLLSVATLMACRSPPPAQEAPVAKVSAPTTAMPAPQAPFDTTPITPVESAGAAVA